MSGFPLENGQQHGVSWRRLQISLKAEGAAAGSLLIGTPVLRDQGPRY